MNKRRKYRLKPAGWILFVVLPVLLIVIFLIYRINPMLGKTYSNEYFGIETYKSSEDKDGDGVDDQTDILNNVRAYIATKPIYQSKYYAGGYPDDGYGVCTDVVAQGLLGSGYDLRELVYQDRLDHPDDYENEAIDKDIDFRRVRNLLIYFRRTAIELTTDLNEKDEWQGGDIVIFPGHIGVVSDRRNRKGIPLLIHHGSNVQLSYEQDILESRANEIIAHFRIS